MINPDNNRQLAVRDPAITEAVPENIDLYGVDWDGPLPVERLNIVDIDPPNSTRHSGFVAAAFESTPGV